jgi:transposase InsO family protein
MMSHANAKLTPKGRLALVKRVLEGREPLVAIAASFGIGRDTARKWVKRYRANGEAGLVDKSSRPDVMPTMLPVKTADKIEALRRKGLTYAQISELLKVPHSTVAIVAKRRGVAELSSLDPREPARRYEREAPGDLVHFDTKKLGRITYLGHRITGRRRGQRSGSGWEVVHLCIDDHSRASYVEVLPDETRETTAAFAERAIAWFASAGVIVLRAMSDNGSAYRSKLFADVLASHGIRHIFTRPYTPRTNGKAERFVQTLLREWAYLVGFSHSFQRTALLPKWLHWYNHHRPHSSIGRLPPFSRIGDNLCGANS